MDNQKKAFNLRELVKKKAVKNGAWMYLLQFFNTVVPLLTLPYITRILGTAEYGIVSIAINILGYYQVIVEYGFGMSATRRVALDNKNLDMNKLFTSIIFARILLVLICLIFTGGYFFANRNNLEQCICILIMMVGLLGNCVQLNWLFQGLQHMKYISIISMVSRIISVICIFLFVKASDDLFLYCLLYSISPFINGVLGLIIARIKFKISFSKVSFEDIWNEIKNGWYVFTTQLSSKVFGAIGITFLGMFASHSEVGIYSAIQKIPNIILLIWAPIGQVIYPICSKRMSDSFFEGKKFVIKIQKIVMPFFLLGSLLIAIFSKVIVFIMFGENYISHFYWSIPLLLWLLLSINNNFLGIQILLGSGHDKEYSKCFQVGVICTIVFNLVLIYFFHGNGACIAPVLSEIVLMIMLRKEIIKIEKVRSSV